MVYAVRPFDEHLELVEVTAQLLNEDIFAAGQWQRHHRIRAGVAVVWRGR